MNIASTPQPGSAHVLLVACNHLVYAELQTWLRQAFPHARIDTAVTRVHAEQLAAQHRPVAVLVNLDTRFGAGFAALRGLHALGLQLPLLAISQFPLEYFHEPAIKAGAAHCVCMATADDSLLQLLRGLLSPPCGTVQADDSFAKGPFETAGRP